MGQGSPLRVPQTHKMSPEEIHAKREAGRQEIERRRKAKAAQEEAQKALIAEAVAKGVAVALAAIAK